MTTTITTGGLRAWLRMSRKPKITDQQLIADLQRVSQLNDGHYVSVNYYRGHGNYDPSTCILRFGDWPSALKKANLIHYEDSLIGQKFGLLTVLCRTEDKDSRGYHLWECQCECGRYCYTDQTSLKNGIVKTCGNAIHQGQVMRDPKTHDKYIMGAYRKLTDKESGLRYPDFDRKTLKTNTSGYVGVSQKGNKWVAELIVKGNKYRAYGFDSPEDAYHNGRLKLEEKYLPEKFRDGLKERRKHKK